MDKKKPSLLNTRISFIEENGSIVVFVVNISVLCVMCGFSFQLGMKLYVCLNCRDAVPGKSTCLNAITKHVDYINRQINVNMERLLLQMLLKTFKMLHLTRFDIQNTFLVQFCQRSGQFCIAEHAVPNTYSNCVEVCVNTSAHLTSRFLLYCT